MGRLALERRFSAVNMALLIATLSVLGGVLAFSTVSAISPRHFLSAPMPMSPQHDSWVKTADVQLSWSRTAGAMNYEVRYAKASTCVVDQNNADPNHTGQFVAQDAIVATTIEPTKLVQGLTDGVWCWQVRAQRFGAQSVWSEVRILKVDTAAPVVTLKYPFMPPKLSGTVDTTTILMRLMLDGVSRPDIPISIAPPASNATTSDWSLTLPNLSKEIHTYTLYAIDAAGNERTTPEATLTAEDLSVTEAVIVLPLIPIAPLIFIPPSHNLGEDTEPIALTVNDIRSKQASAQLSANKDKGDERILVGSAIQASDEGWRVFGVAWYWWVFSGGMGFGAWILVSRAQLSARLNWISAV